MNTEKNKKFNAAARAKRVRRSIVGRVALIRVSVRISLNGMFAQFIDDAKGVTLVSGRDKGLSGNKTERAGVLGEALGKKAIEAGIKKVAFDRGPKQYHGRVKAFAEGLRKAGITV
ncbi:hypothetical protein BK004_00610 [bacterium CG10_46_32]|nr:MAG: hypothetical protein BK004_00610 [bacterium CG10_46_32]PIR56397.1 MAG: 50S ribosomal protein L18 [Parcubacteria group bacterium CG10_big_fil_rev_8_21_14_0_10_46_32]